MTILNRNWGSKSFLVLGGVISAVVIGVFMFMRAQATADTPNCSPVFTSPILNPYPLTFTNPGEPCHDFPALSARVINGGHYANSQAELNQGITANPGDEIYVRLYIHNGAAANLDPEQTNARNVRVATSLDENSTDAIHTISTTFSSDNTNTIDRSFHITTPAGARVVAVPDSGELFDFQANCIGGACQGSGFNVVNSNFRVGEQVGNDFILKACFEQSLFIRFKVRVEGAVAPTGEIHRSQPITSVNATECRYTSTISWSTQNADIVQVTVRNPETGQEQLLAAWPDGSADTPWLFPTNNYVFTLWHIVNGQRVFLASTNIDMSGFRCATPTPTPTPATPATPTPTPTPAPTPVRTITGEIHRSQPITSVNATECRYTSTISWSTQNADIVQVTVRNPETGQEQLLAAWPDGSADTPWLFPTNNYVFTLWHIVNGQRVFLASTNIDMSGFRCATPTPTPTPATPTPTPATPTPTPVQTNNSACVAIDAPDTVSSGQSFISRITVRNTGNTTWTFVFGYRLGSSVPSDNFTWGLNRVGLPALSVRPGENTTFAFNAVAPHVTGNTSFPFAWQMLRENVERFGPICAKQIAVNAVTTPTPTPTATPTPTITPTPTPTISITPTPTPSITPTPTPPISVILEVSKNADNTMVRVGDTLTYTIRVRNNQSVPFVLTGMHDQLPSQVTFDRFLENAGNLNGGVINWPNIDIAPGVTKFFRYQVRVTSGANLLTINNYASGNECFSFGCFSFNVSSAVLILGGTPAPTPTPTVTVTPTPTPISGLYSITKTARNISQNGAEGKNISAAIGDTLQFRIQIVTGGVAITNFRINDPAPFGFAYVNGSTTVNGSFVSGNIGSGLFLGNLSPNSLTAITVQSVVQNESIFNLVAMNVTNTAFASADNAPSLQDSATVSVSKTNTIVTNNQISLQKLGKNITRGEDNLQGSVSAAPSDTLEFVLKIRATSGNLTNVIVSDVLPNGLTYINNTTSLNGIIISDGIANSSGINIGSLGEGQEATIRLNARLADSSNFSAGTTTLTNIAQVRADNVSNVTAQLPVSVTKGRVAGATISRISGVQTGPIGSVTFALLLSALATYVYMLYTKTGLFKKREAWAIIRRFRSDKSRFNFADR